MTLTVDELRAATMKTLEYLEQRGVEEVNVDEDYYWIIDEKELYDPYKKPLSFTLGQLSSDVSDVQKINSGALNPVGFSLVALSALFKYIGEKHVG